MVWIAAVYFTASPSAGSSCPMCLFIVLHAPRAMAAVAITKSLEDMAIVLFESDGLLLRRAAGGGRRRRRQGRRLDKRCRRWRDAGVGPPVEQQVRLVRRADPI